MTSSTSPRHSPRLAGIAVLASAVVASGLTPLPGAATAATLTSSPADVGPVDSTAPTFRTVPVTGLAVDGSLKVVFSEPVRGISADTVGLRSTPVVLSPAADGRSVVLTPRARLVPGATYTVNVAPQVTDLAGNSVATGATPVRANPLVDDRAPALSLGAGTWSRLAASNAVGRTYTRSVPTAGSPSVASVAVFGRGVQVKGCVGPANGVLEVWSDGAHVAGVDTYRPYSSCGVVLVTPVLSGGPGLHRVQLRGVGAKNARSKGTAVAVDVVTAF